MILTHEDLRLVGLWAAECAERVLPLFEAEAPFDARPREAIEGIRVFARGGKRTARLRILAVGALAAAREISHPVAASAARAAGLAAATAFTHALPNPHHAKHVLAPAAYAAQARELAAAKGPSVGDEEIRWAVEHASPTVRKVAQKWPARGPGRGRLNGLFHKLDSGLRS
jgi:immunity protein 5 of polymorphic toxin system